MRNKNYTPDDDFMLGLAAVVIGLIGIFSVANFFTLGQKTGYQSLASSRDNRQNCRVFKNNCGGCLSYGCQYCVKNGPVFQKSTICADKDVSLTGAYNCFTDVNLCSLK